MRPGSRQVYLLEGILVAQKSRAQSRAPTRLERALAYLPYHRNVIPEVPETICRAPAMCETVEQSLTLDAFSDVHAL